MYNVQCIVLTYHLKLGTDTQVIIYRSSTVLHEFEKNGRRTVSENSENQQREDIPIGRMELSSIAAFDEVEEAGFEVFALFDEGHVGHVGEEESLGAARQEGLGDG